MKKPLRLSSIIVCGLLFGTGCVNVEPWEKQQLARDDMALNHEKLDLSLDDHIYFSKEGTSGGRAFAGGGCGCN